MKLTVLCARGGKIKDKEIKPQHFDNKPDTIFKNPNIQIKNITQWYICLAVLELRFYL